MTIQTPPYAAQRGKDTIACDVHGLRIDGRYATHPASSSAALACGRWAGIYTGGRAGLLATIPMTGVMLTFAKLVKQQQQAPFPPRHIVKEVTRRVGIWQRATAAQRNALTVTAHLGYGTLMGALAGGWSTAPARLGINQGVVYGLFVWAASYAGWLPAFRILAPPWRTPLSQTVQLVTSHLVWGACLAWLFRRRQA